MPAPQESGEQTPLVAEERGDSPRPGLEARLGFVEWFCGGSGDHLLLVSLLLMTLVLSLAGVVLVCIKEMHSSALVLDVMVEWLDFVSYGMALLCEFWCLGASPEKRRKYEFRTAVVSTLLLAMTGIKSVYTAAAELICSEDLTFEATEKGDKPCAFMQIRPHPNMMIAVSLVALFAYMPVSVVARFASSKGFTPEESINKAAVAVHVVMDVLQQILVLGVSLLILWDPSLAVVADVATSGVIMLALVSCTSVLWYRYYSDI